MPEVSTKSDRKEKYYPSLYLTWDSEYDLPDSGTMTVKFEKKSESTTKRDGDKSQSVELEIKSIESVEEGAPEEKEEGRGEALDKIAKKGKYSEED